MTPFSLQFRVSLYFFDQPDVVYGFIQLIRQFPVRFVHSASDILHLLSFLRGLDGIASPNNVEGLRPARARYLTYVGETSTNEVHPGIKMYKTK